MPDQAAGAVVVEVGWRVVARDQRRHLHLRCDQERVDARLQRPVPARQRPGELLDARQVEGDSQFGVVVAGQREFVGVGDGRVEFAVPDAIEQIERVDAGHGPEVQLRRGRRHRGDGGGVRAAGDHVEAALAERLGAGRSRPVAAMDQVQLLLLVGSREGDRAVPRRA